MFLSPFCVPCLLPGIFLKIVGLEYFCFGLICTTTKLLMNIMQKNFHPFPSTVFTIFVFLTLPTLTLKLNLINFVVPPFFFLYLE